jgi:hypothetical protein
MDNTVRSGRVPTSRAPSGKMVRCTPAGHAARPALRIARGTPLGLHAAEQRQLIEDNDDSEPSISAPDDFCCKRGHSAILPSPSPQFLPRARSSRCASGILNPWRPLSPIGDPGPELHTMDVACRACRGLGRQKPRCRPRGSLRVPERPQRPASRPSCV